VHRAQGERVQDEEVERPLQHVRTYVLRHPAPSFLGVRLANLPSPFDRDKGADDLSKVKGSRRLAVDPSPPTL